MSTDIWLTPPHILQALGGPSSFDLDPCACEDRPWDTARHHYTWRDDGLRQPWDGRPWCNPPYSVWSKWIGKLISHGRGTALIFAKTETKAFAEIFDTASGLFFIEGRLRFHEPDGRLGKDRATHPSVLCAWGLEDADILATCGLVGRFVPLQIPRSFAVLSVTQSWREAVRDWVKTQQGPIRLADLYAAFASHRKAKANPNYKAKLRQTLQRADDFRRVQPGLWELAA
jgi:DNA N-6-adenine-methyltransferase (Dam).